MLHNETRKLLIDAWNKTHNAKEVAECFSVNTSTVYRLEKRMRETGSVETRVSLRGRKPALSQTDIQKIDQLIRAQPDDPESCPETWICLQKEVPPCLGTGASPMSGKKGRHGKNIYRRAMQTTWCFWMKAASTSI